MKKENEKKSTMHSGADRHIFQNAQRLRENMTPSESLLWEELRMKKLDGLKFRRQHPIGIHILDFYCHQKKLGIEIDGGYHETIEQKEFDKNRTDILNQQNIQVIRFRNEEVINEMEMVLKKIKITLQSIQ